MIIFDFPISKNTMRSRGSVGNLYIYVDTRDMVYVVSRLWITRLCISVNFLVYLKLNTFKKGGEN
ncbi:MAG: hypothetical protein G01um101429_788 [Parcubacteria group bacterium Gr01-1014_29]|nr:MAG: hypothetical protein G01um101429_788 [Parcubacteria group bacterium Gr01-1014_29]